MFSNADFFPSLSLVFPLLFSDVFQSAISGNCPLIAEWFREWYFLFIKQHSLYRFENHSILVEEHGEGWREISFFVESKTDLRRVRKAINMSLRQTPPSRSSRRQRGPAGSRAALTGGREAAQARRAGVPDARGVPHVPRDRPAAADPRRDRDSAEPVEPDPGEQADDRHGLPRGLARPAAGRVGPRTGRDGAADARNLIEPQEVNYRVEGPQVALVKMVDFFGNVSAPELEIDRRNDRGADINPVLIWRRIEMSEDSGGDGGLFFPVETESVSAAEFSASTPPPEPVRVGV